MAILQTYTPESIHVTWNGLSMNEGFAPDTFLEIIPDNNIFQEYNGIGGSVARVQSSIQTATVKVTLMQTSDVNKALMRGLSASLELRGTFNADLNPITIAEGRSRTVLVTLVDCYINSIPDFSLAKSFGTVTWTLKSRLIQPLSPQDEGYIGTDSILDLLKGIL